MLTERRPVLDRWGSLRHADFRLFWTARAISVAGDRITLFALPSVAILALHASSVQVGILNAMTTIAWPLLALFAGVWVDRLRRQRILVVTDLGRAVVIGSIPIAYVLGHLTLVDLFVAAGLIGALTVFFDLAATAHVPTIVPKQDWADANAKLEMAQQAVAAGGPGLAGLLISVVTAPFALLVNAVSFAISGGLIALTAAGARPANRKTNLVAEAAEGLSLLLRDQALVRIMVCAAISNVGLWMGLAVQLVFLYRVMHLSAFTIGICFGIGSVASVVGAMFNRRIMMRLGVFPTLMLSTFIEGIAYILTPVGLFAPVIPLLVLGLILSGFFNTTWNVSVTTFRQNKVRPELLGRVSAASRVLGYGALPLGSVIGGFLGQEFSMRFGEPEGLALTLAIAAVVAGSSVLALIGLPSVDHKGQQPAGACGSGAH